MRHFDSSLPYPVLFSPVQSLHFAVPTSYTTTVTL